MFKSIPPHLQPPKPLFLPSNQPSGSRCVCVCVCVLRDFEWRAVQRRAMTHSPLHPLQPQPLQSHVTIPPSTYTSATCTALHLFAITPPPPAPTHMPSSLAEPHNYFLGETYCLPAPLSLITMEQKQALTGGTRHAALMSAHSPSIFFFIFFPANGRILTCQPLFLTAQHNFLSGRDRM